MPSLGNSSNQRTIAQFFNALLSVVVYCIHNILGSLEIWALDCLINIGDWLEKWVFQMIFADSISLKYWVFFCASALTICLDRIKFSRGEKFAIANHSSWLSSTNQSF